jgi:uncharacterized membrane protein YgcG
MAHTHHDTHDVIIDREGGPGVTAGLIAAIAVILLIAVIGLAVLFSRPWDSGSNNTPNVPGIQDNSGGGGGGNNGGDTGGGSGGDSSGGGSGGGDAQPAQ